MRNPAWIVLFTGGMLLSAAAVAAPPPRTPEEALAAEQSSLHDLLDPPCPSNSDAIVVCGRRRPDRDRLPLQEESGSRVPGESISAVTTMNATAAPRAQPIGRPPSRVEKPSILDVAAMALATGADLIKRNDAPPPPIPSLLAPE
jgi:hypothetical protein